MCFPDACDCARACASGSSNEALHASSVLCIRYSFNGSLGGEKDIEKRQKVWVSSFVGEMKEEEKGVLLVLSFPSSSRSQ